MFLEQRVRADDNTDGTVFDAFEDGLAGFTFDAAGK